MAKNAVKAAMAAARASAGASKKETKDENAGNMAASAAKAAKADTAAQALVITKLNANALSVDVGPKVLTLLDTTEKERLAAYDTLKTVDAKRYDALSMLTAGIVKAAKGDAGIDLEASFGTDKARKRKLSDQLYIALGIKELFTTEGGKTTAVYTKSAAPFFSTGKEDKATADYKRKRTIMSNFSHMMSKCTQAATGVLDLGGSVKTDEKAGTLLLSGPKVVEHFGGDAKAGVLLDGKQREGMKVKPSFTELGQIAAANRGTVAKKRADSRTATTTVEPDKAIITIASSLTKAIEAFKGKVTDDMQVAIDSVISAWENIA